MRKDILQVKDTLLKVEAKVYWISNKYTKIEDNF